MKFEGIFCPACVNLFLMDNFLRKHRNLQNGEHYIKGEATQAIRGNVEELGEVHHHKLTRLTPVFQNYQRDIERSAQDRVEDPASPNQISLATPTASDPGVLFSPVVQGMAYYQPVRSSQLNFVSQTPQVPQPVPFERLSETPYRTLQLTHFISPPSLDTQVPRPFGFVLLAESDGLAGKELIVAASRENTGHEDDNVPQIGINTVLANVLADAPEFKDYATVSILAPETQPEVARHLETLKSQFNFPFVESTCSPFDTPASLEKVYGDTYGQKNIPATVYSIPVDVLKDTVSQAGFTTGESQTPEEYSTVLAWLNQYREPENSAI